MEGGGGGVKAEVGYATKAIVDPARPRVSPALRRQSRVAERRLRRPNRRVAPSRFSSRVRRSPLASRHFLPTNKNV